MRIIPEEQQRSCREGSIWMPGVKSGGYYSPLVDGAGEYAEEWRKWVLTEYLDKISVWRCPLEDDGQSLILESQIQLAFRSKFELSYYKNLGVQSWLGRVEVTDRARLSSVRFEFAELPNVEPESRRLLADLVVPASEP
jgi:hypothetical protein